MPPSDDAGHGGVMSNDDRLVYMANQIARNLASAGPDQAADATAEHITAFWDPRMKQRIAALLASGTAALDPAAAAAIRQITAG